ncbi:hypothetical protein KPL37_02795 [Clostridium frigoris]|uniref:FtsX-like permease family protein n=1 Tax=Clostridium frigoris TaxID=205327 RepID=A0ABS6BP75_9CLOT|nr:hypothetical protein [Clostridium frigoris]MBU3158702.1 hypothetical protein [Clostridium frigoris]
MKQNVKNTSKKSAISIVLFISAIVVAILGVALLINNIYLYKTSFSQAVAQGYSAATVRKALVTSQLLPGILQPIALYGGVALLLLGVSKISNKVSKCLTVLTDTEVCDDALEENVIDQNTSSTENVETTK